MKTKIFFLTLLFLATLAGCQKGGKSPSIKGEKDTSLERVKKAGIIVWGADVVGDEPYVYEDPKNPGTYIGFEMDIAKALARQLGIEIKLVSKPWDTLIPELQKGSFDMVMNGIEDTEERKNFILFSDPYYVYFQQLTVRKDTQRINRLEDLKGKRVATLSGTAAEDILRQISGVEVIASPENIYIYYDLQEGKIDAVLLDNLIAVAYGAKNPKLKNVGEPFGKGRYVIVFRKEDMALRVTINQALDTLKKNGELKAIYAKWGIMNQYQEKIGVM